MPQQRNKSLELYLKKSKIASSDLRKAINYFYNFIEEITNSITVKKSVIKWEVEVKEGSARFISEPEAQEIEYYDRIPYIYAALHDGFTSLTTEARRPAGYTDYALETLKEFILLKNNGLDCEVKIDNQVLPTDGNIIININEILGYKEEAFGSIEGRLDTITARQGLKVILYESLTNRAIRCYIEEKMLGNAFDIFRKKVYVFGVLRYNVKGEAISIQVKQIEPFRDPNSIPTFRDMYGFLK